MIYVPVQKKKKGKLDKNPWIVEPDAQKKKKLIADIFGSHREMEDMVLIMEALQGGDPTTACRCTSGRSWSSPSCGSRSTFIASEEGAV